MANPQKENGYTGVANEILEKLLLAKLNGTEWEVLMCVIRKTYGFQKKEDWISYTQFEKMTGKSRPNIWKAINGLVTKSLLVTNKQPQKTFYRFNKDYSQWVVTKKRLVTKKKRTSYEKEIQLVTKAQPTKETSTKETSTKEISTNVDTGEPEKKEYGNEEINRMLEALRSFTGRGDFKESRQWQRRYSKNFCNLVEKIGKGEFRNRLQIVSSDSFKEKNCNSLKYLYSEIKSVKVNETPVKSSNLKIIQ